ncbi:DUF523 domain-containing protein [Pseudodesulfovibrio sp. zrk46]|uniref:DUF523 domain-containing protein n=1 Tax=Pseudodesulfovibrio sp. zrk46 TaxID=2725288 RepID=UPI0014499454|nr:DUF523 domain-containing protein [Pseudodesulfovibrio sp. zrk46]QJB56334.1 DUF523 domain-containing protein [Pseudodesulfovibrio sp. zrk46]
MSKPIIVSACLAGIYCRYNGDIEPFQPVVELVRQGRAIPFCPEVFGGLSTPRSPCEIADGRVINDEGEDKTEQFQRGAEEGLRLAQLAGCTEAILKARSPSCGSGEIYDGSFSSTRIPGDGFFAALLKENGISVRTEQELED